MMLTSCESFTRASVGPDGRLYDRPKTPAERAIIWLKTHAVTYTKLRDAARNLGLGVDPSGAVPFVFQVYAAGSDKDQAIDRSTRCLEEFRNLADRHGAVLSIVYVPLSIELDFAAVKKAGSTKNMNLDPDRPLELSRSAAARLDLPFYNLRPILEDLRIQGSRLHLRGDFHYDAPTSRSCAQGLWQAIEPVLRGKASLVPR